MAPVPPRTAPDGFRVYFAGRERRDNSAVYHVELGRGAIEVTRKIKEDITEWAYMFCGRSQSVEAVVSNRNEIISLSNYNRMERGVNQNGRSRTAAGL